MKKILIALVTVAIITNLGCRKQCGCKPPVTEASPTLGLVIKNSAGADLLDSKTVGYIDKSKIQLYAKDESNVIKQIRFEIRQPFTYGTDLKIDYYQLLSSEIGLQSKSIENIFYLKLGDKLYELNLKVNNNAVEKLLIDKVERPKELPSAKESYTSSIYTLKI